MSVEDSMERECSLRINPSMCVQQVEVVWEGSFGREQKEDERLKHCWSLV